MAAAEKEEGVELGEAHVVLVRDDVDDAPDTAEGREGGDERIDAQRADHESVHEPDQQAGQDAQQSREERPRPVIAQGEAGGHAPQADHGADRYVDAAAQDHQRLPDGHDPHGGHLTQHAEGVVSREEGPRHRPEECDQEEEGQAEPVPGEHVLYRPRALAEPPLGGRTAGGRGAVWRHVRPPVAASINRSSVASLRGSSRTIRPSCITRMRSLICRISGR